MVCSRAVWGWVGALLVLATTGMVAIAAEGDQKLAVVNVSYIFEQYRKVPELQRKLDEKYKGRKAELEQRGVELARRNDEIDKFDPANANTVEIFDAIQKLRREKFFYDRELGSLNAQVSKDYVEGMREILNDIRQAIRVVGEEKGFALVLRSPSTDDPKSAAGDPAVELDPALKDSKTQLELREPKTAEGVLERFNRNPVLMNEGASDITELVLRRLNEEYVRRLGAPQPPR